MIKKEKETAIEKFYPASKQEWRSWLKKNHKLKQAVWMVCYKKDSDKPSISWSDAVDEAICFGWIDSIRKSIDHECYIQFYSKRKPNSVWSKINKEKVEQLTKKGRISTAGFASIALAKQNGSWTILDAVETLEIPMDLEREFKSNPGSKDYFLSLSKSVRKSILQWLVLAKRPETRLNRISEIAELAAQQQKPKQF